MMKYFILFLFISNISLADSKSDIKKQPVKSILEEDIDLDNMRPISINSFKLQINQEYIDKIISSAMDEKYPDDSIKIIPNARKKRRGKHIIERPGDADITYYLESVISSENEINWFSIINKKAYNNQNPGIKNLFEIIQAAERYIIIKFLLPEKADFEHINKNKEKKHKYCEYINISEDKKSIIVKLSIGQLYDSSNHRIYDGL